MIKIWKSIILIVCTLLLTASVYAPTNVVATAYCIKGTTANGTRTRAGIIAADTNVYPFGTRIALEGLGTFTVADRGGAIKGNRIDIWMKSCSAARQFGKKRLKATRL